MKTNVKKILDELYVLDPGLKNKEVQLLKILNEMVANKPDIHMDAAFKEELHQKIMTEIAHEKMNRSSMTWQTIFSDKRFFALASIAIVALLGIGIWSSLPVNQSPL